MRVGGNLIAAHLCVETVCHIEFKRGPRRRMSCVRWMTAALLPGLLLLWLVQATGAEPPRARPSTSFPAPQLSGGRENTPQPDAWMETNGSREHNGNFAVGHDVAQFEPPSAARTITPRSSSTPARLAEGGGSILTTITALAGIIVVILVASRLWQKHGPKLGGGLSNEVLELLGKRHLDPRQCIYMLRIGGRIIVVGSSPAGLNTLAEITDPVDVDLLAGACRKNVSDHGTAPSFATVLQRQHEAASTSPTHGNSAGTRLRARQEESHV